MSELVSCPRCLDVVNQLLGLPLLAERHPNDTLGPDNRGKGGGGDGATQQRRLRSRAQGTFEHQPQELRCAVNGFVISTLKVVAERIEQTLHVNLDETIGFVEVFSEQGVRLLYHSVEPPPCGDVEQTAQVELSAGRQLNVSLSFDSAWPNLRLVYHDPQFTEASLTQAESQSEPPMFDESRAEAARESPWRQWLAKLRRPAFWPRPAVVTALVVTLLLGALLAWLRETPSASAAELLRRAGAAEKQIAADPALTAHRSIELTERDARTGALISHRRIEVWQSRARRLKALRVRDEQGRLIAGEWRRDDGGGVIYRRDGKPAEAPAPQLSFADVWRWEPTAGDFVTLIGQPASAIVAETAADYVIRYRRDFSDGLTQASLVLRRADLRVSEQSLTLREGDEAREYRFTVTRAEQQPNDAVAPAVFEPEAELLGQTDKADEVERTRPDSPPNSLNAAPALASAELEVEVLQRLQQTNALSGEQISLTRTAAGALLVQGLVETGQRKQEILQALEPFIRHPALKIEVATVAEMQRRMASPAPIARSVQSVEVAQNAWPVEPELRRYFERRSLAGESLEQELQSFARRVFQRSTQVRARALALKQIAGRFTAAELQTMEPASRARWRALVDEEARAFRREAEALRRELEPVFAVAVEASASERGNLSDAELAQAAKRLFELATVNDAAARRSFAATAEPTSVAPVKTASFWRALRDAENLAARIAGGQQ